ncbi:family 2A encapsulin nanocompartment cargo protein cysteine desulfurase [Mycobacterium montefiorense]|uniref:Cysteine desulfurase n=1 Tax=Mycobacterium montefiorense TaxID=154654 RepID=A0AA37V4T5_9MYCO|nr:family 2A encapsulin nanocompartment cargo protein cysteine desulfurase [Mycobacterium montefiorense]GBG40128.1 putative cysteine desulfurase 1 [Mycobacterium montefiorense]GKU36697.1 putative cysteine desulfurase 1 [Mycobacterium montefiorense]GKU38023.1 putative cysteine desulfurase 1 [Mycobacterium montefiorense]GKU47315.1 putative cysteine desulfurase 1 [Mycobacterium montefiorense]GKU50462.1 putative cysteine desulfurase 1 [Mycobacterium montefiorense]
MSTSEFRSVDAESDLPLGAAELAALASQLYAASIRPGPDSPPQAAPVAPRGSVPDTTAATSAGQTAAGSADLYSAPVPLLGITDIYVPAPTSPQPEPPPQAVPVASRGNVPDTTAAPSGAHAAGSVADPHLPPADFSAFEVPSAGIVPTVPGVLAGAPPSAPVAPRGSAPYAGIGWLPDAPSVGDLGWSDAVPAAPAALNAPADNEYSYHFLTSPVAEANRVPRLPDNHEVFDVNAIRKDFPILKEQINGKPLIWFDNAATTQKPQVVIDRLSYFYAHENSNIHRAAHELAARSTDAYEEARETVRRFIGAPKAEQNIFVRGTTEAINLVAYAWGGKHLLPGDEIVITHLEHHANIVPWQLLSRQTGAVLKVVPVDEAGNLLLSEFEDLLGPKTKLVAATQVSNALGTVTPVEKIVELGHRYGARVLIDGAQSIPHLPIDVAELGVDFFVFSGHKIYGPTGIGVLYGSEEALAETPPWQGGGNMIADVTLERSLYQGLPNKFEAGTGNIADAVGLGEALRYVERVGIERIAAYEHALLDYATPRLADIPGVRLVGTADEKASVLSFVLAGHEPLEVGKALNAEGIAVRAGHHCAQPILRRYGLEATVRPSFAFYNTFEEIDVFLKAVRRIAEGGANVG